MANIHVNPNTGEPGRCDAKHQCRFGNNTPHFDTNAEARAYYEKQQEKRTFAARYKKAAMRFTSLGGAMVMTFSLSACSQTLSGHSVDPRTQQTANIQVYKNGVAGSATPAAGTATSGNPALRETGMNDLRDKLSKAKDKLENDLKGLTDNLQSSGSSDSSTGSQTDPSGVYFQGKPLRPSASEVKQAESMLSSLPVRNPDTSVNYNRAQDYGRSFESGVVGRLEHRDVTDGVFKNSSPQSRAVGGDFVDPYTGKVIQIVKGSQDDTDVDHLYPLKRASEMGGSEWNSDANAGIRHQFANDPINMEVVSSSANRAKGDSSASDWLPSYKPAQCTYAISEIQVTEKYKSYGLAISPADKATLNDILETRCN